ncbi:MAG: amino acid ABC transporter permease [Azospirillaceae bacterium]|nr:amino acid ABC transporter permease [Azospirillaceae bacterium]
MTDYPFLMELWAARGAILNGLGLTVAVSLLAIVLGSILGLFVGIGLTYGGGMVRFALRCYTELIRGTPVFVLILACFYILPVTGIQTTAFQAGLIGLLLFCGSHVGEIVRGALQAIPRGQSEAGKAIGLSFSQNFVYVLMPQALRQILPTWVNAATEIVKASTLLSVIGVTELLLATQQVISRTFIGMPFYLFAGAIYFAINFAIEQLGRYAERKVSLP